VLFTVKEAAFIEPAQEAVPEKVSVITTDVLEKNMQYLGKGMLYWLLVYQLK
jgi:hypothetical protein